MLLLDEVAGGLTEHECAALVDLIRDIRRSGVSIIWIEHIVHALTAVVDRLVESRLAYRHTDAVDRRRVLVHLGADGREIVERVCRRVERSAAGLLGSTHSVERERLAELLAALAVPVTP